jgi:hypothetical protein
MATNNISYPKIAEGYWWKLRELLKQKVPAAVTKTYLATALSIEAESARANIIGPFKMIGIIDDTGKPTDLAYDWRDDNKYKDVCKQLRDKYYPQELRDLFDSPEVVDIEQLINWFMHSSRCGKSAAQLYAKFYVLLLKSDPKGAENSPERVTGSKNSIKQKKQVTSDNKGDTSAKLKAPSKSLPRDEHRKINPGYQPELHINIQLHISPESTAEQIDKIFESMAKHLKGFTV